MSRKREKPKILDYYSLCTLDCEELGGHVGEWIECDRCGAPTHVKVFEVMHPEHGYIKVGRECFKDVMGYTFKKTHEKALETRQALLDWMYTFNKVAPEMDHPPRGPLVMLGLPGPLAGYKYIPVHMVFQGSRGTLLADRSFNWDYSLRHVGVRPHPRAPFGWSKGIITAGLDLGLWEPRAGVDLDFPSHFKADYIFDPREES